MVKRNSQQIVGFDVARDKSPDRIQRIIDSTPPANTYFTDGYTGHIDVVYPGKHVRNMHNKRDTFTVEGINADLRHYIPLLARRSRRFARSLDTLLAVLEVSVDAYNQFGLTKYAYRKHHPSRDVPFALVDFL